MHLIRYRIKEGSRLICRSVSPANGTATKEAPPRSVEKPLRTSGAAGATTKPPREPNRPLRDARVTAPPVNADDANPPPQRKNSTQGVTLDDIATKIEKGHYMIVMQAEKTSIGVHQLVASLKHGGLSAMIKDGLFADESAVTVMLRMFNETKRWDINICSMYLPKLKGRCFLSIQSSGSDSYRSTCIISLLYRFLSFCFSLLST
ncbi:hypothetical protein GCK32_020507 [Trichostrongylus colubriformis]|uniref:Uncharacterized protein n=1 Tax=Trichostrongylus colubriformis TaxID=6319 RepID=A0AAN8FSN2_TRICO